MGFPVLEPKTVLQKRWKVLRKLAEGGFGAVYEALDQTTKLKVALKLESCNQPNPVLKVETTVLLKLRGQSQHACGILGSGVDKKARFNYIVMNLIGKSLADLHHSAPNRKFSETTVVRLGIQCLKGIHDLHKIGFVHRDIKPGNFAIGRKSHRQTVYLLDFGLARYYHTLSRKGKWVPRPPRDRVGFRGTVRYASINAHSGLDLGRHDDIWSLFYVLIEFQRGKLPWNDAEDDNEVSQMKRDIDAADLLKDMADEFNEIYDRLKEMRYDDAPDYDWFREQFRDIQRRKKLEKKGDFEWEEGD